jgi:flagellar protein FlgJ
MTTGISANSGVYGDFAGLEKLKASVRRQDPSALRQVAQQFESLFTRMMLKSMRQAIGKDPIFGTDQAQMYQGMFDDQLSVSLSRGRGLGLADVLMRQLRSGSQADTPAGAATSAKTASGAAANTTSLAPTSAERADFVRTLWPQAQQAAQQLGVQPLGVLAQAALESNWGQSVPRGASGAISQRHHAGISERYQHSRSGAVPRLCRFRRERAGLCLAAQQQSALPRGARQRR